MAYEKKKEFKKIQAVPNSCLIKVFGLEHGQLGKVTEKLRTFLNTKNPKNLCRKIITTAC